MIFYGVDVYFPNLFSLGNKGTLKIFVVQNEGHDNFSRWIFLTSVSEQSPSIVFKASSVTETQYYTQLFGLQYLTHSKYKEQCYRAMIWLYNDHKWQA